MKTLRQSVGSFIVIALLGAFMTVGASAAKPKVKKTGWWIRIDPANTHAAEVSLYLGTSKRDSRGWRTWKPGQREEFDLPAEVRDAAQIYLRATAAPNQKVHFCVFFRDHGVESFHFDGDSDHNMKQSDSDDDCHP